MGVAPIAAELFEVAQFPIADLVRKGIAASDAAILMVGACFDSAPPFSGNSPLRSCVQMEFDVARELAKLDEARQILTANWRLNAPPMPTPRRASPSSATS